jgi:hypothetical protein
MWTLFLVIYLYGQPIIPNSYICDEIASHVGEIE